MTENVNQIERDLAETRRDMARTINELQSRVSPRRLLNTALGQAKRVATETPRTASHEIRSFGRDVASGLGGVVRDFPVPVAMVGIGLAWLMIAGQKGRRRQATLDDTAIEPLPVSATSTGPEPRPLGSASVGAQPGGTRSGLGSTQGTALGNDLGREN